MAAQQKLLEANGLQVLDLSDNIYMVGRYVTLLLHGKGPEDYKLNIYANFTKSFILIHVSYKKISTQY